MSGIQTVCPLHVGAEQVSALYDGDLDAATAAALREHLVTCDVCQQRLDSYARISATLRAQIAPQPDARLRQGVLAARERGAGVSRAGAAWRAVAVAATIAVIVGGFAGVLLRQAASHRNGGSPMPTMVAQSPTATTQPAPPPGWTSLLPGKRLSFGGSQGLAVSRARPGRLVGCAWSGPYDTVVSNQTLDISDDGGKSWQVSAIQHLAPATECAVVVDQVHPDTIVVGDVQAGQFAVTTDAGQTWRPLDMPGGLEMQISGFFPARLVNGRLIGEFRRVGGDQMSLGELSIDGHFTQLDATLPYPDKTPSLASPMAFTVDPADASHLYVVAPGKYDPAHPSSDVYLYTTTNAGVTWHETHDFAFGERLQLWSPMPGVLYFWINYPEKSPRGNPLQISADGGATWRNVTPAGFGIGAVVFGPEGRIVLWGDEPGDSTSKLDELDPLTGKLTSLGQLPPMSTSGFTALVTGGPHPQLIVADPYNTYARSLP